MNTREKRMIIAVATLVGLLAVFYVYSSIAEQFTLRDSKITDLQKSEQKNEQQVEAGRRATKRITDWNHRSLPSNKEAAPTIYLNWLLEIVEHAKLESPDVHDKGTFASAAGKNTPYEKFAFQVKGRSDLNMKQLVQFLYEFYASNQLHTIRQLTINPENGGKKLEVTVEIEALLLPGADRTDSLSEQGLKHLARGELADYQKLIGGRNLFAEYTPPKPLKDDRTPAAVPFDVTKYTSITAIIEEDGGPQLWVLVKPTGDQFRLKEGEEFTVGGITYKVVKIGLRNAVLTTDGKQVQVSLGENLHDAAPVPAGEL
jgi:hypothetical protein